MKLKQDGFTLVEILVITPVVMLTIMIMTSYLFNLYGQLTQQGALLNLQVEGQNIVFSMQDDIFFTDSFNTTKNANLVDAFQPSGGWYNATNPQTLILSTPALTNSRRSVNRQPVYINTLGCDETVLEENSVLYNNVIYFASGTNLYKRTLSAPSSMSTCGTSFYRQTCPKASSSPTCPADRKITDKLHSFTLTYYDANNVVVTDPTVAEKIKINLVLKDKASAEDIYADSSITLKKLNQ